MFITCSFNHACIVVLPSRLARAPGAAYDPSLPLGRPPHGVIKLISPCVCHPGLCCIEPLPLRLRLHPPCHATVAVASQVQQSHAEVAVEPEKPPPSPGNLPSALPPPCITQFGFFSIKPLPLPLHTMQAAITCCNVIIIMTLAGS